MGPIRRALRTAWLLFSRNPLVRPADRLESLLILLLLTLTMATIPLAASVGSDVYSSRAASAIVEQQTRHQVTATLQRDAPVEVDYSGATVSDTTAPAWWRAPDGRVRLGTVSVEGGLRAGDTTTIWIDQTGAPVAAPRSTSSASGDGVAAALGIMLAAAVALSTVYGTGRFVLRARNRARWQRDWRTFEPRWSGGIGREPA